MTTELIADINAHETRVAMLEDGELTEIHVELRGQERLVGNIYKGRVANILPGMQAAFVDVGLERNAFLYAGDILADKSDLNFVNDQIDTDKEFQDVNIKDMLKQGQEILVQVLKQQGGTKGVKVTTHITLPGRMIVLMPTVDHVGVSGRIGDEKERNRLKDMIEEIKPEGMGVIVRTAAQNASREEFMEEIRFLVRMWQQISNHADFVTAPRLVHAEETLLFRTIRDRLSNEVDKFIINDKDYYEKAVAVAGITVPNYSGTIEFYDGKENIFDRFDIEPKIEKALQRKVWLKSGSYLVIDETEALTVIDVNTGKYIGEDNLQDTIVNTNIEAADEIARQLRLRDIGGIIVIDFIDMESDESKEKIVEALKEALKKDKTKTNVMGITQLGLVEMTRKKVRQRLSALLQTTCENCSGSGKVYSAQAMAMRVRREVHRAVLHSKSNAFVVEVAPPVAKYIVERNNGNEAILEDFGDKSFYLSIKKDAHMHHIKVTSLADAKKNDKTIKDAQIFC